MAAGLGFKTFTTGEVLTAADTNGYLMQGVLVFADAAARTAAITSPQEGQMSYLKSTDSVESYSGTAWVAVGAAIPTSLGFTAGKNAILNGDCRINQRGTTSTTTSLAYLTDRWQMVAATGTVTGSVQAFTPGTAPVSGYESTQFMRVVTTGQSGATAEADLLQKIEDVRTFAGQTVTFSFWAKAASGTPKIAPTIYQYFGSGGSSSVTTTLSQVTLSTSWARYSVSVTLPSISGKTITTGSYIQAVLWLSAGTNYNADTNSLGIQSNTFDVWGIQLEAGSTATAFQTATGTIEGELAACQRYYETGTAHTIIRNPSIANNIPFGAIPGTQFQVAKRAAPTITLGTATTSNCYTNSGATYVISTAGFSQIVLCNSGGSAVDMSITQPWTASIEL